MDKKEISQRLVHLRIKNGLTQSELAIKIGVSESAVSNYENGIRIPRDSIKVKIADVFNLSIETIFF